MLHSSLVVTRRGLRHVFLHPVIGKDAVAEVVAQLSQKSSLGIKAAVLLGIVAGVCSRLPDRKPLLETKKDDFLSFWIREVINSRTLIPKHISTSFIDFFTAFVDKRDLQVSLVPALEKALLRAPEVVLDGVLCQTLLSLPESIDLTSILASHLLKPLLSNVKSSNDNIKKGVVDTFSRLMGRCKNEAELKKVAQDLLAPLVSIKATPADQRALLSHMIVSLPSLASYSSGLVDSLAEIVGREPNEAALATEVPALANHAYFEVDGIYGVRSEKTINAFTKGLSDRKPSVQKIWALSAGNLFWQMGQKSPRDSSITKFVEALITPFLHMYKDVIANPLPSAQSGLIVAAHVTISQLDFFEASIKDTEIKNALRKAKVFETAVLGVSNKPSILLNYKVYSKIADSESLAWMIRALRSCSKVFQAGNSLTDAQKPWAEAFIYLVSTSSIPTTIRTKAVESLTEAYLESPRAVSAAVINCVWDLIYKIYQQDRALNEALLIRDVIYAITPTGMFTARTKETERRDLDQQLIEMLVLCRPELLPSTRWIDLCIRTGRDPGTLVRTHCSKCLTHIHGVLRERRLWSIGKPFEMAISAAYAELAFVAPDVATSQLVLDIYGLDLVDIQQFSPTDFAIARAPEGIAFVDVLSSKKNQDMILDKNSKDYNTLKWEEEVRKQINEKKGQQQVKLSTDDQAKVQAQIELEVIIRERVLHIEERARRSISIVLGLANGPPTTDVETWLNPCVKTLLGVISCGVGLLVGNSANKAYLACAQWVSPRLGVLRHFIGVATLRALGASELPRNLVEEPLGGQ